MITEKQVTRTRKQFAEQANVTPATIRLWDRKGLTNPVCYVNGRPRYSQQDIDRLLNKIDVEKQ